VVQAYENDPLVHDRISARLFAEICRSGQWALDHASEFPLPLLLMHGGDDRLTSAEASRQFAEKAGGKVTLRVWDGLYHEMHNEPEKGEVQAFMLEWLNSPSSRTVKVAPQITGFQRVSLSPNPARRVAARRAKPGSSGGNAGIERRSGGDSPSPRFPGRHARHLYSEQKVCGIVGNGFA
jgi:acetyl esterase/lipase